VKDSHSMNYVCAPNKGMQLTTKSVTPFACAKAAPPLLAADPGRYVPSILQHRHET
jgi:hypothetical protein